MATATLEKHNRANGSQRTELVIEEVESGSIAAVASAEVDVQIATAHRFPRSIKSFHEQALALATLDQETASSCFYSLPRGGKPIEGPSARLAEIVLSAWGNARAESRVVEIGSKEIVAEALCWDLEKNVAVRIQCRRRITDKYGKRYNDDMIVVTGNAATSIALRNAVFKVVPGALTKSILQQARRVAIGDAKTLVSRRSDMVSHFGKMGVKPQQVCAAVNRPSVEDITLDDLATLVGLANAIKDGDTTVDEVFRSPEKKETKRKTMDDLAEEAKSDPGPEAEPEYRQPEGELANPDQLDALGAFAEENPKEWEKMRRRLEINAVESATNEQARAALVEIHAFRGKGGSMFGDEQNNSYKGGH